jgi:hypothetical protein
MLSTCAAKFDDSVSPTELGRDVIHFAKIPDEHEILN